MSLLCGGKSREVELVYYTPNNAREKSYFELLWKVANKNPRLDPADTSVKLKKAQAVEFLARGMFGIDYIEGPIWAYSSPSKTEMDVIQFYTALRYIALLQNGGDGVATEFLQRTAGQRLRFPEFYGIPVPEMDEEDYIRNLPTLYDYIRPPVHPVDSDLYQILPAAHTKYHTLFLGCDTDNDGFVTYDEALPIMLQQGLHESRRDLLFSLVDLDKDQRLNSKEFCAACRLSLQCCVTVLPSYLRGFMATAPDVPPPLMELPYV
eukprot:gene38864-47273_t